jgi:hypothetical protein
MRTVALALLFSFLAPLTRAQDPPGPAIKLPAEVKAAPATIAELRAETAGKAVEWVAITPGLSLRAIDNGKTLLFSGPPGRYELLAYTAAGDVPSKPARVTVVIDAPEPMPPPKPVDDLKKKLGAAAAADGALKADVVQLAAIYREAAKAAADKDVPHSRELLARVRKVSSALLGDDALPATRGVVAEELLAALGMSSEEPLTDGQRRRAAELFGRLAELLSELGK